ncbi:MAG TPA: hypothetical protein VIL21_07155 [Solirubrobacterales bacterium]|jgi:hypothetical protein
MALAALLCLPFGKASAAGGATIAAAPSVTYGKQLFGNTAVDDGGKTLSDCVDGESWWALPVLAGDHVKIDYEGGLDYMQAWDVGTTDFNIHTAPFPQMFHIGSNDKEESVIEAPVGGTMPLRFYSFDEEGFCIFSGSGDDYKPGPYDFIASVQHALSTAITPVTLILRKSIITGAASLADGSLVPDGLTFNLVVKWHSGGELLRASYPATTAGGALAFQLALPPETAGKTVRLAISRPEDTSYQASKSVPLNVKVKAAPRHRHHRHRHKHHHRHHHR